MPKFKVAIARSTDEYATVTIEAESDEAAQAEIERLLEDDDQKFTDLVNGVSWELGDTADYRVIDSEEAS